MFPTLGRRVTSIKTLSTVNGAWWNIPLPCVLTQLLRNRNCEPTGRGGVLLLGVRTILLKRRTTKLSSRVTSTIMWQHRRTKPLTARPALLFLKLSSVVTECRRLNSKWLLECLVSTRRVQWIPYKNLREEVSRVPLSLIRKFLLVSVCRPSALHR